MRETEEGAREQLRALRRENARLVAENARLLNETREALEQQTATAEILRVISSSPGDVAPVFDAIVKSAARLCGADYAWVILPVPGGTPVAAFHGDLPPQLRAQITALPTGAPIGAPRTQNVADIAENAGRWLVARAIGARSLLRVRIGDEAHHIGSIVVAQKDVRPFSARHAGILEGLADQAAIAIDNVRLFNETKEALEQQTAISDVLASISGSVFDLGTVLRTIAERALALCRADQCNLYRVLDEERIELLVRVGTAGVPGQIEEGQTLDRNSPALASRSTRTLETHHVADARDHPELPEHSVRARLAVPIVRDGTAVGTMLLGRFAPGAFSAREIELVQTFAQQAGIAIENVRLFNETKEALERQTAVSEILRVMAGSPTDVAPVLQAIAESAARFCSAENVSVILEGEDGLLHPLGNVGALDTRVRPFPVDRTTVTGRSMLDGSPVHVHDLQAESEEFPLGSAQARMMGHRTTLATPLVRAGRAFGAILLRRGEVRPFTEKQVDLVRTFADQAVIAIDNVRLFNETKEALERQTATAEILRVISGSLTDVQPVLDAIAENAVQFCGAEDAIVSLVRGADVYSLAHSGSVRAREGVSFPLDGSTGVGRAILELRTIHIDDLQAAEADFPRGAALAREMGYRTVLIAPLLREDTAIGSILLRRDERRPFSPKQIELLETFASQAVIAMENVRLFNETKEALDRQTAVSDILKVISASPTDIQPVLDAIASSAARFTGAEDASVLLVRDEVAETRAHHGPITNPASVALDRGSVTGAAIIDGRLVHVRDVTEGDDYPVSRALSLANDEQRTVLAAPLMRDGKGIGAVVLRRREARSFSERQVDLVRVFADQAVIALENVRLFNETKEALEQQTATSEVLQAISRSAFDLQAVLDTVVERAAQLCGAEQAWMRRIEGDQFRFAAYYGSSAELRAMFDELRLDGALAKIDHAGMGGRAILEKRPIHVRDIVADEGLRETSLARRGGGRTALAVPMLRDGEPIGAIVVARNRVAPFNDREIRLVETFADQAVIAIENVRLFYEIQEQSRQLEIAGKHKSEFLANMSHELRTPLNAIIGFSEVLLQGMFGELNEKQREYQQDVLSSGRHLLSLINDILDLAKIEAGRVELELTEFSLPAALENGVTMIRERAARHSIRVDLDVGGVDRVVADERKVKQIVFNLLSNAVKFTRDGGRVGVRASREDGEVRVAVRDTGIGIDEADRERIFEEFQQASRDPERSREGTGLGLALTRRYVELHGGRIWVESAVGRGSTFTFALPVVPPGKEG